MGMWHSLRTAAWLAALAFVGAAFAAGPADSAPRGGKRRDYDVVVAGGGMGGIAAAIQAARLGASVLVVEPSAWVGGQATVAGVSTMDDLSRTRSGLYLEFVSKLKDYYDARGKAMGTCYWDARSLAFEPHVGHDVLMEMVEATRGSGKNVLDVLTNASVTAVRKEGHSVRGVALETGRGSRDVTCRVLIDATEYGDLLSLAGLPYRVGNSVAPFVNPDAMIQDITWAAVIKKYPGGVPEELRPVAPLPGYDLARRNYESYVIAGGANFKGTYPVVLPVNFVSHNAYRGLPDSSTPWTYDGNAVNWPYITKCGVNWGNDYPGKYGWEGKRGLPAAYLEDPALREEVERQALIKTLHFIYYVQNELQENWSVADDEYWNDPLPPAARELPTEWQEIVRRMPPVPYVRESRRAVGQRTLTSAELLQNSLSYRDGQTSHEFPNAIAIGGYILDLHGADTDSDMEWELGERAISSELNRPRGPFQVPLDVLIPSDVEGFLVAEKNLSMSRLSAGALRLQPICMMTGQAAGALAALSAREGVRLRDLPAFHVQWALLNAGVELSLCRYSDVPPEHPCYRSIQISNLYGLTEPSEYPHASSYNIQDLDDPVLAMALIKGDDKGVFGTDEMITRKEMASMIARGLAACGAKRGVPAAPEGKPDAFVTRGVLARELCAAFGFQEAPRPQKGRTAFRASEHPNAPAVNALAALGVLDIYRGDGEFRFGHPVTRSEAIDVLVRAMAAAGLPGK